MQPRFATQASAAALSRTAKTVECPLGNETGASPTKGRCRAATRFWWEELALHAARVALHMEGAPPQLRQGAGGEVGVVAHEVALRQSARREEHLVGGWGVISTS